MLQCTADAVMAHLRSGGTFKDAPVATPTIRKHRFRHPDWWIEAKRLAMANSAERTRAASRRRVAAKTHCKHGHPLSGDNVAVVTRGRMTWRRCLTCNATFRAAVRPMTHDQLERASFLLREGVSISSIYGAGEAKGMYVTCLQNIQHQRLINPAFDRLVVDAIARRRTVTLPAPGRHDNQSYLSSCGQLQYDSIRRMIPRDLPSFVRDDIAQDVVVALLEGRIDRSGIRDHLRQFLVIHRRMFPANFAKFGDARLLSLDETVLDGGTMTRGDAVSEGLWA